MEMKRIYNDPVDENDIANKRYVDKNVKAVVDKTIADTLDKSLGNIIVDGITNKNLFDISNVDWGRYELITSDLSIDMGNFTNSFTTYIYDIQAGETISISAFYRSNFRFGYMFLDSEHRAIKGEYISEPGKSFEFNGIVVPNNTTALCICQLDASRDSDIKIQIEKGNVVTEYSGYKKYGYNSTDSMGKILVDDIDCKNLWSLNSSYSGTGYVLLDTDINIPAGTYTISFDKSVNSNVLFDFKNSSNQSTSIIFNDSEKQTVIFTNEQVNVAIYVYGDTDCTISNIQIEKGRVATEYAPYKKYGYNSQESMGKIVVDDISCKNLFNIQNFEAWSAMVNSSSPNSIVFENNGLWAQLKYHFVLKKNTNYVLKYTLETTNPNFLPWVSIQGDNYWGNEVGGSNGTGTHVINFNSGNWDTIDMVFPINGDTNLANVGTLSNVQLEEGFVPTKYTPYKSLGYTSGHNENGSWVKYDDGRMECTQIISLVGLAITEVFGYSFFAIKQVPNFPIPFKEAPIISFGLDGGFTVTVGNGAKATAIGVEQVVILRPEAGTIPDSVPVYLHITAKGYWK